MAATALSIGFLTQAMAGDLPVIYDSEATEPLAPYLEALGLQETGQSSVRSEGHPGVAELRRLLPIRTPELTPGPVARRPVPLAGMPTLQRPLFLIGADARSRQWLVTHRERLLALGAVGMLVQAESLEELRSIAMAAQGLPILPASASDVARIFRLRHYPVLITRDGIEP